MQTKRQIQELLSAAGVSPNRKLGQHFLVDLNLMRLLVDSAQIGPRDVVLEIGTGTGSLTEALAERAGHVVTVELDRTLAGIAQSQLARPGTSRSSMPMSSRAKARSTRQSPRPWHRHRPGSRNTRSYRSARGRGSARVQPAL